MKFRISNVVPAVVLFTGIASALSVHDSTSALKRETAKPRRVHSLLINPAGQPAVPSLKAATTAANAAGLNLDDIQGDILIGMKKMKELFYFFGIADVASFKTKLATDILPLITTTTQMLDNSTQPITLLNIAFSQRGLDALNVSDSLGDSDFFNGQFEDAQNLGDPGTTNWVPEFTGTGIHGVLLFASDTVVNINDAVSSLESAMGNSMTKVYSLSGAARPAPNAGHEHFGFLDGISNPPVNGFTPSPLAGQSNVSAGEILVGEDGDFGTRPDWAKGGSFLVFRQLKQLVPEVRTSFGARMVGRWKSGAPVELSPLFDDPVLGADRSRNNDFTFAETTDQSGCPFGAHIRKTRPRIDLGTDDTGRHIMRAGIPYGPEVSTDEATENTTSTERGLAFVSYQSTIGNGFKFLQQTWANSQFFAHGQGPDPIIGALAGAERDITGLDPTDTTKTTKLTTDFVVSRGGEYFFSPPLSAISGKLSI
ncbi:DyP-type peroxidase [Mycena venus]|uniref:DyP-type peroxidase n=1 Tax=Mycena venus TaxID=2733690 RepID=A0A8H6YKN7_9AGAR|nr:DyP-type peroxidase [Mycena venus]